MCQFAEAPHIYARTYKDVVILLSSILHWELFPDEDLLLHQESAGFSKNLWLVKAPVGWSPLAPSTSNELVTQLYLEW